LFFTIKQVFFKLKSWKAGRTRRRKKEISMKKLDVIAAALVIIGALNWGLAGVFHLDLVAAVFGMKFGETSFASSIVYALVALSGLYQALTWKSAQRRSYAQAANARA
jgi:uncharacterized membrane protein YuzA (DUF378 family)